jgi:hypothetical protein
MELLTMKRAGQDAPWYAGGCQDVKIGGPAQTCRPSTKNLKFKNSGAMIYWFSVPDASAGAASVTGTGSAW